MKRFLSFTTLVIALAACTSYKPLDTSPTMSKNSWDAYYKAYEGNLHDYNSDHRLSIKLNIEDGVGGEEKTVQYLEELGYEESEAEIIDHVKIGEYFATYTDEGEEGQEQMPSFDIYHQLPMDWAWDWGEDYLNKQKTWVEENFGIERDRINGVYDLWGPFDRQ